MIPALYLFAPFLLFYQSFSYGQHEWPEYDVEDEDHFYNDTDQWNDLEWVKETDIPKIEKLYTGDDKTPVFYQIDEEKPIKWSNLVENPNVTTKLDTDVNLFSKIRSLFDFDKALETIQDKRLINNYDLKENKGLPDVVTKETIVEDIENTSNETFNLVNVVKSKSHKEAGENETYSEYAENKTLSNNDSIEPNEEQELLDYEDDDLESEKVTEFDLLDLLRSLGILNDEFEEEMTMEDGNDETTRPLDSGDRIAEIEKELEIMEECERNARASECECTATPQYPPFYPWYQPSPYFWPPMPMPYYVPYAVPVPIPVPTDAVQNLPVTETVPVKGKVTIVGRFNDCNWNHPQYIPPELIYAPPVANPEPYCDVIAPDPFIPYTDVVPVSGRVRIAANFDDGVFGPYQPQPTAHFFPPPCQQYPYIPAVPQIPPVPQFPAIPGVNYLIPEVPVCGQVPAYGEVTIAAQF